MLSTIEWCKLAVKILTSSKVHINIQIFSITYILMVFRGKTLSNDRKNKIKSLVLCLQNMNTKVKIDYQISNM